MNEPIILEPGDYWKLLKLGTDLELAQVQARAMTARAAAAHGAFAKSLELKYPGFVSENARYVGDDATCSLTKGD